MNSTAKYLKKAKKTERSDAESVRSTVQGILDEIEIGRDNAAISYAKKFDRYEGNIVLSKAEIAAACTKVSKKLRNDIRYAHNNVRRFAKMQLETIGDAQLEINSGLIAGQKCIPCNTVGCYVPGGRYSHVASAIMTVTTAKVAGCKHIALCSPPHPQNGINSAIVFAAELCGADTVLALGGVQAVAAMAFGLFGLPVADILAGPGNQYVAEAKRLLFGRVGIDLFAGPTDTLILADANADAEIIATDLVGQSEHGPNSPVRLISTSHLIAQQVIKRVPELIGLLPQQNRTNATAAWRDYAEVILCNNREQMAEAADSYAPEHLTVQAADTKWWLRRLRCYGSLFLGEETTVAFGDKASGPNHVLPTSGAARYTGGLSVHKFMKIVTWQHATREGMRPVAEATARISRLEGMEAHARTADVRLQKYFPEEDFDLGN